MSDEAILADVISAFPSNVSPSDQDQLVLTRGELNRIIAGAMKEVRLDIEDFRAEVADERAFDRRRIRALEEAHPKQKDRCGELGGKTKARLARLEALLIARSNEPITFAEIGKYLELGTRQGKANTRKQNMTVFGKIIKAESDRFQVFDSKTRRGSKMVRLNEQYYLKGPKKR
jgi:hypothetical protein